jgi:phosphohistidine phosphatase
VRHVWLLRHAKSSWDDPGLADRDRPLSPRGVRAAAAMATYLATVDAPRLVLCSAGLRARQTLATVLPSLGAELEVRIEPELYTFDPNVLLERLRRLDEDVISIMVVGHNPALEDLAVALTTDGELRRWLDQKFPTAALATIELPDRPWTSLAAGTGVITRFVTPSDLHGATRPSSTAPTG